MAVATEEHTREFLDVVENVWLNNPFPVFEMSSIRVFYGNAEIQASYATDYEVEISPPDYNTFRVRPTSALLVKINALIASDVTEVNRVVVKRVLPLTTTSTPALCQSTQFVSREFDRIAMKLMQINGGDGGNGGVPPVGGGIPEAPDDGYTYGRKNLTWSRIILSPGGGGDDGVFYSFPSRQAAIDATIPVQVVMIAVLHSGQMLFYRRYVEGGVGDTFAPLKSNSGSVAWSPAADASPLHWGAEGDGVTNDRIAFQNMMRFYFGTPETNGIMENAWANQRPLVVTGHQRTYALAAPLIWGNPGTLVDTGMVYNFVLTDCRFRAIAGDWGSEMVTNVPKAMLIAAWKFDNAYTDEYSGIYDVILNHVTFDCSFLTGATWVCNTYQFVMHECRYQHCGYGKVMVDTSPRNALAGTLPFGYDTGNGAYTLIRPNVEGLVGESEEEYPGGNTIDTMNTIGIRLRTNDFRVDGPIISRVSRAIDISGRAGQIYNLHPWSREVYVRAEAHNVMFCNGYLDYTKFIFESFGHMLIGMHWILPADSGSDRGVELRATTAATNGAGMLITGCTFNAESLGIKYTTSGVGTWVGDKARKVSITGCKYGTGHSIAQIERFEDKHGFTVASGAHWFRTGDVTLGEIRLVGDILYVGKDRTDAGPASVQLQGLSGDQTTLGLYAYAGGGAALANLYTGGYLALSVAAVESALFISGSTGAVNISRTLELENDGGAQDVLLSNAAGDFRTTAGAIAVGTKRIQALADTTPGVRITGANISAYADGQPTTSAVVNLTRSEAGHLLRGAVAGTTSSGAGITINSSGVFAYATSSDARLKHDFKSIDPALIDAFDVYDFEWILYPGMRGQGVKAQDITTIVPDAVTGTGVIDKPEDWDERYPGMEWEPEYFGVDYSKLVPLLIATVKDLRHRVAELEGA